MNPYEIYHFGVLGMKWGVRRNHAQLGTGVGVSKKRDVSEDYKKAHVRKNVKTLSDSELRARLNRLQMENQYKQLSQRKRSAGEKFVTGILTSAMQQTASNYASKYMSKGVDALIKRVSKK